MKLTISQYTVSELPEWVQIDGHNVTIEKRDDNNCWAIVSGSSVLAKDGAWEYEPRPSSRTDEFKQRTRYTINEAMDTLEKFFGKDALEGEVEHS